ncbi:hypothetical protein IKW72_02655 [bacterium]|nr:hypothetical protein [bacterium]
MAWRSLTSLFFCLLASAFLTGCATDITLRNAQVKVTESAKLGSPAVFFLDKVATPLLVNDRIGKIRAVADGQWNWVKTKSDLSLWADREWETFLQRHGQTFVTDPARSNYHILCDVSKIYLEKFNEYLGAHKFASHVVMRVTITRSDNGSTVYSKELKQSYAVTIPVEGLESAGDEAIYNHCLSAVFQNCLEKIVLP